MSLVRSSFGDLILLRFSSLFLRSLRWLLCGCSVALSVGAIEISEIKPGAVFEIEDRGYRRQFEVVDNDIPHVTKAPAGSTPLEANSSEGSATNRLRLVAPPSSGGIAPIVLYEKNVSRTPTNRRFVTKRVVVRLNARAVAAELAVKVGAASFTEISYAPGYFIFEADEPSAALAMAMRLRQMPGVLSSDPLLGKQQVKKFIPNDPLFGHQWYLLNQGQSGGRPGMDLHLTDVWERYRGRNITIAIVDDGLQMMHPDLASNVRPNLGYDYRDGDADPNPGGSDDFHGTSVAGVAAARGNNGIGIAGVAFEASLIGIRLIGGEMQTDEQSAAAMVHSNQVVHVSNNSWGASDDGETLEAPGPLMTRALENSVRNGRGGRGTVFVWSGGNGGDQQDNVNYDGYANSIYTIAVGAIDDEGRHPSYSEPGACLVVVAPSSSESGAATRAIATTDLIGVAGTNSGRTPDDFADGDYTQRFDGTSASAPMVSGIVALMLEANANLGWRDVQEIIMRSATKAEPDDSDWITNSAGFHFNHKFGAGLINAAAAVDLATRWTNLGAHTNVVVARTNLSEAIPDNDPAGITLTFDLTGIGNLRVEHVTLTANIAHSRRGDLAITLISPSGTRSRLAEKKSINDVNADYSDWKFMSVFNWGENSQGQWKVNVADVRLNRPGTIHSLQLEIFGSRADAGVITLIPQKFSESQFHFLLSGRIGQKYEVQSSVNLFDWISLLRTNMISGTPISLSAPAFSDAPRRFFRAVRIE